VLNFALQEQDLYELDLSMLAKGIYFVNLQTKGSNETKKLIIQ
jgi:hypothetical protein